MSARFEEIIQLQKARMPLKLAYFCILGCAAVGCSKPTETEIRLKQLKSEQASVRVKASAALGESADLGAVSGLTNALLRDPEADVRKSAAESLGRSPHPVAIDALILALRDSSESVSLQASASLKAKGPLAVDRLLFCLSSNGHPARSSAAKILAEIQEKRAIAPLLDCLRSTNDALRASAAEALGKLNDARAVWPLVICLETPQFRQTADAMIAALVQLNAKETAIDSASARLKDEIQRENWRICGHLGFVLHRLGREREGERLVASLVEALGADPYYLPPSATTNGRVVSFFPGGRSGTRGTDSRELRAAILSSGHVAVQPLLNALNDTNGYVRTTSVQLLGKLGDPKTVEPIVNAGVSPDVKAGALFELRNVGGFEAMLREVRKGYVSEDFVLALDKAGWQPKTDTEQVYRRVALRSRLELIADWEQTKRVLMQDVKSWDPRKAPNAIDAFLRIGESKITPELAAILKSEPPRNSQEYKLMFQVAHDKFLYCGNGDLHNAAITWLTRQGHARIVTGPRGDELHLYFEGMTFKIRPATDAIRSTWGSW